MNGVSLLLMQCAGMLQVTAAVTMTVFATNSALRLVELVRDAMVCVQMLLHMYAVTCNGDLVMR